MTEEELLGLLDGDKIKVDLILSIVRDVMEYSYFDSSKNLGVTYRPSDLSFSKMMLYSWIKEATSGRKY